ncbi:hypothetical protein BJX70DRAFT_400954 [Aspergillus crustosus]
MIQEWLSLVLKIVVMILAAALTTLSVRLHSNSAFAGASLHSLMSFGESLAGIVIFYTRRVAHASHHPEGIAAYTVISVSHRLDMIMDFDRVVVLDRGAVVEVGNPEVLMGVEGSRFGELVRASRG